MYCEDRVARAKGYLLIAMIGQLLITCESVATAASAPWLSFFAFASGLVPTFMALGIAIDLAGERLPAIIRWIDAVFAVVAGGVVVTAVAVANALKVHIEILVAYASAVIIVSLLMRCVLMKQKMELNVYELGRRLVEGRSER